MTERVATAEVGILTLINNKLREMLQLLKSQIPEGKIVKFEGTVTTTDLIDCVKGRPYHKLFSADIYNDDDADDLYVKVNDGEETRITPKRATRFDFGQAKIEEIQLRVASGDSITYEITGLY